MKGYEYRKALAEVLDEVHRRTIVKTLSEVGVKVAYNKWSEIEKAVDYHYQLFPDGDELFSDVEYVGSNPVKYGAEIPIGVFFGEVRTLTMSGRTRYISETKEHARLGDDKYRRQIGLFGDSFSDTFPHFTTIFVLRDIPPVAVEGNAIIDIRGERDIVPDVEIIERATKEYGRDGAEFLNEEMAQRVIYALQKSMSKTLKSGEYYS